MYVAVVFIFVFFNNNSASCIYVCFCAYLLPISMTTKRYYLNINQAVALRSLSTARTYPRLSISDLAPNNLGTGGK